MTMRFGKLLFNRLKPAGLDIAQRLQHYRLENGNILITQSLAITRYTLAGRRKRTWEHSTIALTEKQLARLARRYLSNGGAT